MLHCLKIWKDFALSFIQINAVPIDTVFCFWFHKLENDGMEQATTDI